MFALNRSPSAHQPLSLPPGVKPHSATIKKLALLSHFVVLAVYNSFFQELFLVTERPTPRTLTKGEPDMKRKSIIKSFHYSIFLLFLLQVCSAYGAEADKFPPGTQLPQFAVGVPDSPGVQEYLGLKNGDSFKLSDIAAKMVLIEFSNST
jgi:hypothetical protein